ncbi:hypothetical protein V8Z74_14620 [Comamonas sp. w2-DMI]|uniref:hypothetical protein n=1 Tax=Comamonas sp. w2-DMI TaxID=3126391 RepID=UPI0032E3C851
MAGRKIEHCSPALEFSRQDEDGETTVSCCAKSTSDATIWSAVVKWIREEGLFTEMPMQVIGNMEHETYTSRFLSCYQFRQPEDMTPQGLINLLLERGFVKVNDTSLTGRGNL